MLFTSGISVPRGAPHHHSLLQRLWFRLSNGQVASGRDLSIALFPWGNPRTLSLILATDVDVVELNDAFFSACAMVTWYPFPPPAIQVFQMLLADPRINPNLIHQGPMMANTPLLRAIENNNPLFVKLLLDHPHIDLTTDVLMRAFRVGSASQGRRALMGHPKVIAALPALLAEVLAHNSEVWERVAYAVGGCSSR